MFIKVAEFHRAFGQLVATQPMLPDRSLRDLRICLLQEEYDEYVAAEADDDLVEIADALADMVYIACGTAVSYGVAPDDYEPPFVDDHPAVPILRDADLRAALSRMLAKDFNAYLNAEASSDIDTIRDALLMLIACVYGTAFIYSIPLSDVLDEVHRSNMSKLGLDGLPIYREDGKILKGPNYTPPDITKVIYADAHLVTTS